MAEVQIGMGKAGRRAYGFDDIAIVPSRRTRDPEEISVAWQIDAYRFEAPIVSSAMDSVVSPDTAIEIGRLGGRRRARSRRSLDPLRRSTAAARRDRDAARGRRRAADARDLRRADQGRTDRRAHQADSRRRRRHCRRVVTAANGAVSQGGARGRCRLVRDPRHHGVGRARLVARRAVELEEVHLRPRRARSSSAVPTPTRLRCT